MASTVGTKTVKSGLVFHYDMGNTQKSWKGAPTTNLLSNSGQLSLWGKAGGIASVIDTALAPNNTNTASLVTANGTTNSFISLGGSVVSGNTYTKSVIAKAGTTGILVLESYDNNGSGGTGYYTTTFNLSNGTYSGTGHTASITDVGGGWYHCIATRAYTLNASGGTFYIGAYGAGTGTLYLWHPMMEQSSTASAYTSSSRNTTQAILDITKNNTITATSLIYASNNTFSFNGASSTLSCPPSSLLTFGTSNHSCGVWLKTTSTSGGIIGKGTWGLNAWGSYITANTLRFEMKSDVSGVSAASGIINDGAWHYVCASYDRAGSLSVYTDGILSNSSSMAAISSFTVSNSTELRVNGGAPGYAVADIPSAQIYNRALIAAEVTQNFEATRSRYGI